MKLHCEGKEKSTELFLPKKLTMELTKELRERRMQGSGNRFIFLLKYLCF
jgi:hypothetical protein